jgi:tRNA nucleotidyltransferase (CCA-adding enzyme)
VNIEELVTVARADFLGRTTEASLLGIYEAGDWLLAKAKELDVYATPLTPLVQGKDLIALGLEPSKRFKSLLNEVYEKQLSGEVQTKEEAIEYLKVIIKY